MEHLMKTIIGFFNNEEGATAIEYSLIAGFLSIVIAASVTGLGSTLSDTYNWILSSIQ